MPTYPKVCLILTQPLCYLSEFSNWEGKIGVGEGLVLQSEVPPFAVVGLEAVGHHGAAQYHAVLELFGCEVAVLTGVFACLGIATVVGMALAAEPVESAAHVDLLLGAHVEERQVERRAARVAAMGGDVVLDEEAVLALAGVEIAFHRCVIQVFAPAHEVVDSLLRTVGVVNLQAVALLHEVVTDGLEAVGSLAREKCRGLLVAVDAGTHKVIGAEVTDFEDDIGHHIGNVDKIG